MRTPMTMIVATLLLTILAGCEQNKKKPATGLAEVNGTSLYYEVKGEGEPLVFIHGGLVDHRMWDAQFEHFSQDYRVVRYDVRGHGKSGTPAGFFSHATDLSALLDFLGIGKAHLMGLSMGAAIAIDFALAHPEKVSALIAVTPALMGYDYSEEFRSKSSELYMTGAEHGPGEIASILLTDDFWAYAVPSSQHPTARKQYRRMVEENTHLFAWHPRFSSFSQPPAAERLSEIQCPTLIIGADGDYAENQAVTEYLEQQIQDARRIVIPEAGHMVNMEKPGVFNDAVSNFLSAL